MCIFQLFKLRKLSALRDLTPYASAALAGISAYCFLLIVGFRSELHNESNYQVLQTVLQLVASLVTSALLLRYKYFFPAAMVMVASVFTQIDKYPQWWHASIVMIAPWALTAEEESKTKSSLGLLCWSYAVQLIVFCHGPFYPMRLIISSYLWPGEGPA